MTAREPLDLDAIPGMIGDHRRTRRACAGGSRNCPTCTGMSTQLEDQASALVAEVRALRRDLAANEGSEDARLAIAEAELVRLRQTVERLRSDLSAERAKTWKVATLKCWTNEDGQRFVFVSDLQEALGVPVEQGAQS